MNIKKLFLLGMLTSGLILSGCDKKESPKDNSPFGEPSGDPSGGEEYGYSEVLKDCGSQIMQLGNASSSRSRGFKPYTNAPAQALAMPGVYLYWSGLLNEIDGVNIIDSAINFSGTYKFNGMGGVTQQITFDLSVHFDETNNKFAFLGKQNTPGANPYSYLILTCDYNFTSKELGGFSILMQPSGFTMGNYMRYSSANRLEEYTYGSNDGHETDPDYIEYSEIARNGIETLEGQIATEEVLSGAKLDSAIQAFVDASDYCDEVCEGINFDVEVAS